MRAIHLSGGSHQFQRTTGIGKAFGVAVVTKGMFTPIAEPLFQNDLARDFYYLALLLPSPSLINMW